jgi:hypothetical protein
MRSSLLLDDYAMVLIRQLAEAYDDLNAVHDLGDRDKEETVHVSADNGIVGSFVFPPTDTRERRIRVVTVMDEFLDHVLALDQVADIPAKRVLRNPLVLDRIILDLMRSLRREHPSAVEGMLLHFVDMSRKP